jgi:hypothetical protein
MTSNLANGIKLEPIKLAKNVSVTKSSSGYRPPQKRTVDPSKPLDLGEGSFPSLGKVQTSKVISEKVDFKGKILQLIEKDALDEAERNRQAEVDPFKMTPAQLEAEGYSILKIPRTDEEKTEFHRNFIYRMNIRNEFIEPETSW